MIFSKLLRREPSPAQHPHAERLGEVGRRPPAADRQRLRQPAKLVGRVLIGGHVLERSQAVPQAVEVHPRRKPAPAQQFVVLHLLSNHGQPSRLLERRRLNRQLVDHREDRRDGADAERQHGEAGRCETGVPCQHPQPMPHILRRHAQPQQRTRVPALFLRQLDSAEVELRSPPRLLRRQSFRDVVRNLLIEVEAQLLVQQLVRPLSKWEFHQAVSKIKATALESRCQSSVSAARRLRPLAVKR